MPDLLVLSAADVRTCLPMPEAIEAMKQAFAALSAGRAVVPLRASLPVAEVDGRVLAMPAYVPDASAMAVKLVTVFGRNPAAGRPLIHAAVVVFDHETGVPTALIDGAELTAIRTGAGGGASVDLLARRDSRVLAMLGSGVQARAGLAAVRAVRDIVEVRVFSPNRANAQRFADEIGADDASTELTFVVADTPAAAVRGADIVYTATTSTTPTFDGADLGPGTHVVGVGSFTPDMVEVDATTIARALVVVDERAACWEEAGELLAVRATGVAEDDLVAAELGEVVAGTHPGRTGSDQITFFKSVGVAVQDAVAAQLALATARSAGIGSAVLL